MSTEKVQHEYGADEIQILEGLEAVRKRCAENGQQSAWTAHSKLAHIAEQRYRAKNKE